ncbi:MAG TPA: hypothetical protein VFT27_14025 [Actinomycetota bacterium]|nr:hypothetical protein [Actinomycetota bacterium]
MGPAMHGGAEALNDWLRMGIAGGVGVLAVTIVLALGVDALLRSARRLRDRRSSDQYCRAFAQAVARGDLEVAEDMADLAFARSVRGGSGERGHPGAQARPPGRALRGETTLIGSRDDHR